MRDARLLFMSALSGLAVCGSAVGQAITMVSPAPEANGRFGSSVSGVPDVDGNARGEMAVGAPNENPGGVNDAGRVYLYSYLGLRKLTIVSPSPENGGQFGFSVSGVDDVNGDAKGDIIIGAPFENPGGSPADSGRVYLFSGATGVRRLTLVSPNAEAGGLFGWSVAGLPDINGNGRGDIAVGAPNENPGGSPLDSGRAYVLNGYSGAVTHTLVSPNAQAGGGFGTAVAGVPDVDGDGRGDVIVGALFEDPGASPERAGRVYVYSGRTGALLHTLVSPQEQQDGTFGNSVAGVPDCNGDGRGDILVGAPYEVVGNAPEGSGRAYLFSGANGALLRQFAPGGPAENDIFGFSVAGCKDLNGDGRGDLIIAAKGKTLPGGTPSTGRVFVYSGANGVFIRAYGSLNPQTGAEFGAGVTGLDNLNGDGKGNVGSGSPKEDIPGKADAGRAYMFRS